MRLIYHDGRKVPTPEQIKEMYPSVPDPSKISGYEGFFFTLHDVYIIGTLESDCKSSPSIEPELQKMIQQYRAGEYGDVTYDEKFDNQESRWLCGSCSWTIARYFLTDGRKVILEFLYNRGFLYFEGEPMIDFIRNIENILLKRIK